MIVLDAAALVDVVLDQPAGAQVLPHLSQPILAPAHQRAEVLSAIARLLRSGDIEPAAARAALVDAASLEQEVVVPDAGLLRRALDLQDRIGVLDGLYVVLAAARGCPLVTTDQRLARSDPPCQIVLAGA